MKRLAVPSLLLSLLLLSACVHSLHGIADENNLTYLAALEGSWAAPNGEGDSWIFEGDGSSYRMTYLDPAGNAGNFHAALCTIEGQLYLDIMPDSEGFFDDKTMNAFWFFHLRPMHNFMRVELEGDSLRLAVINAQWFEDYLLANPNAVGHELPADGGTVLTAKPGELQAFVSMLEGIEGAWGEPTVLERQALQQETVAGIEGNSQ